MFVCVCACVCVNVIGYYNSFVGFCATQYPRIGICYLLLVKYFTNCLSISVTMTRKQLYVFQYTSAEKVLCVLESKFVVAGVELMFVCVYKCVVCLCECMGVVEPLNAPHGWM